MSEMRCRKKKDARAIFLSINGTFCAITINRSPLVVEHTPSIVRKEQGGCNYARGSNCHKNILNADRPSFPGVFCRRALRHLSTQKSWSLFIPCFFRVYNENITSLRSAGTLGKIVSKEFEKLSEKCKDNVGLSTFLTFLSASRT